jgi:MYXO-CTERM domain-containing protein
MTSTKAVRLSLVVVCVGVAARFFGDGDARAAVPAGYKGTPFDPAVAGGTGIIPPTVTAGPYAIPGRIDLVNYDLGGEGVAYHSDAHYTTKDGDGYRTDRPTATMCKTLNSKPDIFYGTATAQDGMFYPSATTNDFYAGSVHPGDWFNYTVDVKTAGTYALSSTFSTGNGPPGGEGGDGQMELQFFVNGTKAADWKETFPDYQNKANFHNWKPYPHFTTLTLEAGLQVIKIQLPFKHLNVDYLQFDLMGAGGAGGTGGTTATSGAGGAGGATSTGGATGAGGTTGTGGTTGAGGATNTGGTTGAGGDTTSGAAGGTTTGAAGAGGTTATGAAGGSGVTPGAKDSGGCACSSARQPPVASGGLGLLVLATALGRRRRRVR